MKVYKSKTTGADICAYSPEELSGPAKAALDVWYGKVAEVAKAKEACIAAIAKEAKLPATSITAFLKYGQVHVCAATPAKAKATSVNAITDIGKRFGATA